MKVKIGVIGHGSWGTAITKMLCETQKKVYWWIRNEETLEFIKEKGHNPNYLQQAGFDITQLQLTTKIDALIEHCDYIILAIPSIYLKTVLDTATVSFQNKTIFSAIKGIIPTNNTIVGDFLHLQYHVPYENIGVLSGPCHAEEVAMERLSYLTIACTDLEKATVLAKMISSDYIKTKISDDIYGTEYATVLKNIYAMAAGIANGLGYGDNYIAVLASNAIREMKCFVDAVHPIDRDIKDSAYLGDLLVTAYSNFSRNRMFGNLIGKGYSVEAVIAEMRMIAEGYYAAEGIHRIVLEHDIQCPITEALYGILYQRKSAKRTFENLSQLLD